MSEPVNHYFSSSPSGDIVTRKIEVELAGAARTVLTAGSVFSPEQLDRGTAVLLKHIPAATEGPILDLGCGWGPISLEAALDAPEATVWAIDVNERARALTAENARLLGVPNITVTDPDGVPDGVTFQEIRSNPPIRIGKAALHELLQTWIPRLASGGIAYLVVAKHLGADSLQRWLAETFTSFYVSRFAREKGFHIITVERPATDR